MSDIPLHTIRRQKPPERAGNSYLYNGRMPTSRRTQDNKRKGKHRDDSDEEAGLLDTQYDVEGEYNEPSESSTSAYSSSRSSFAPAPQQRQTPPPKFSGSLAKDSSRTIPFNPSSKHVSTFNANFYNKILSQANSNHDIRLILSEIKSTMLSHSYPSCSMNNSNSSSTYTSSLSPYLN